MPQWSWWLRELKRVVKQYPTQRNDLGFNTRLHAVTLLMWQAKTERKATLEAAVSDQSPHYPQNQTSSSDQPSTCTSLEATYQTISQKIENQFPPSCQGHQRRGLRYPSRIFLTQQRPLVPIAPRAKILSTSDTILSSLCSTLDHSFYKMPS